MSAEHFETVMSCDMRTAPNGRDVEYAESMTGHPRWLTADGIINRPEDGTRTWMCGKLYAEHAIRIAADAVRDQPMDGISGDHPERREHTARILDAAAELVRVMALDDACDGTLTQERWDETMGRLFGVVRGA